MTFIITLIALIIERFFHWSQLRHWRWFKAYQRWLGSRISTLPSYLVLTVYILPLLIVVGLINHFLGGWGYGIPKLVFGILILLYCMGPDNLWVQAYSCLNELNKEDPKVAVEQAKSAFGIAVPENSEAFHQALTKAIFIQANQRIFAVIFWFVILGPVGAVLYRSLAMCAEQSESGVSQTAMQSRRVLDWIPVRLLAIIFALGGHFIEVFTLWKRDAKKGLDSNDILLAECGLAALEDKKLSEEGSGQKAALELIDRSFVIGLVILAMIAIMVK